MIHLWHFFFSHGILYVFLLCPLTFQKPTTILASAEIDLGCLWILPQIQHTQSAQDRNYAAVGVVALLPEG